jgi:hypothetical protein
MDKLSDIELAQVKVERTNQFLYAQADLQAIDNEIAKRYLAQKKDVKEEKEEDVKG